MKNKLGSDWRGRFVKKAGPFVDGQLYFVIDEFGCMALVRYAALDHVFRLDVMPSISMPADEAEVVVEVSPGQVVDLFSSIDTLM